MPSKNTIKIYVKNGIYHLYNRGAGGQNIFQEDVDYKTLLNTLSKYLSPTRKRVDLQTGKVFTEPNPDSLHKNIKLLAYCLMPNHYHFIVKQNKQNSITEFTRKVFTKYSMYFNNKNGRMGTLFQGRYKASYVDNRDYLLFLSAYVHLNPVKANLCLSPKDWQWSSYNNFISLRGNSWFSYKNLFNLALENSGKTAVRYEDIISEYLNYLNLKNGDKSKITSFNLPKQLLLD